MVRAMFAESHRQNESAFCHNYGTQRHFYIKVVRWVTLGIVKVVPHHFWSGEVVKIGLNNTFKINSALNIHKI